MGRMPLHGVKSADGDQLPSGARGKLLFPHLGEWRELTLFSEELRLGEAEGLYEYEPIDGISFNRGPVLRETMETLFAMKAKAKAEGKSAKEKAVKIIANSTYGFFGQRTEDRESLKIFRSGDVPVYEYLARNALIEEADHGRYAGCGGHGPQGLQRGCGSCHHLVRTDAPLAPDGRHHSTRRQDL